MGRNRKGKAARGRRNRRRAPTLRVVREAEEMFRTAILAGLLSAERSDPRWAGHYMYMFHDEDGTGWFKHRDTRAYLPFPARRQAAAGAAGEYGT